MIPVFRPAYDEQELRAVREILDSGWSGLGPRTAEFETRFAEHAGAAHAVGMASGTAALHLGMALLGLEGREVVTTSLTFVSTNHAILYNGATPVFADVDPASLCVDPASVAERITDRTAAVVAVDFGGHPADLDALRALCAGRGIALVEDAAHSCGAFYRGRRVGSIADLTCFSFHAVKNLSTGEGGMATVGRQDWNDRLRRLRWLGIDRSTWDRSSGAKATYNWQYDVGEVGFKAHLSDIASAIGLVQLAKLDKLNARRRDVAAAYDSMLADVPWVRTPTVSPDVVTAQHNYVVRVPAEHRDRFVDHLATHGVSASVHYFPNHLYSVYEPYRTELPVTEAEWRKLVTLPMFPDLTEGEIAHVVDAVRTFPI